MHIYTASEEYVLSSLSAPLRRRGSWLTAAPEQNHPAGKRSLNTQENYNQSATAPPAPPSPEEDDTCKKNTVTSNRRGRRTTGERKVERHSLEALVEFDL